MSLIPCPECGTDISDRATKCPYCGFQSEDPTKPISEQDQYDNTVQFHIVCQFDDCDDRTYDLTNGNHNKLFDFLGNWKSISEKIPQIAIALKKILKQRKVLVANIDGLNEQIKDLIDNGIYRLQKAKDGRLLAQVVDSNGKLVKQVDLIETDLKPDALNVINNLQSQAQINKILNEIRSISEQLEDLRIELSNDRLAKVESAFELLAQANYIRDKRLRDSTIINAMNHSTEAKHALMRNFEHYLRNIKMNYGGNKLFSKNKDCEKQSRDAFEALQYITKSVQVECVAYSMLGQFDVCKYCLEQYESFIERNELDNRDTLLMINENFSKSRIELVDQFEKIVYQIAAFKTRGCFNHESTAIPLSDK